MNVFHVRIFWFTPDLRFAPGFVVRSFPLIEVVPYKADLGSQHRPILVGAASGYNLVHSNPPRTWLNPACAWDGETSSSGVVQ